MDDFARKLVRDSNISPQAWCIHSTQKINDMNCNQLMSDPSAYVEKSAQRSVDSILLRHMDDVVGTGPEEHLMSDLELMKTNLHLTDVVILRHEGDTVNFLGLEITKTRKAFEVKNSTDLVESLLKLYGLQKSKPTVNPGGARVSNSTGWSRLLQLSHSRRKTHLHGTLKTRHAIRHPHKSSTPRQRASAQ